VWILICEGFVQEKGRVLVGLFWRGNFIGGNVGVVRGVRYDVFVIGGVVVEIVVHCDRSSESWW
jgi:hypothetical protein